MSWSLLFDPITGLVLTWVGTVLTFTSLFYAERARKDAKRQGEVLAEQRARLDSLNLHLAEAVDALSTRYLGPFPTYLPRLVKLVDDAQKDLRILCCMPGHGIFSAFEDWTKLRHAIERKLAHEHLSVCLTFNAEPSRIEFLHTQLPEAWNNWSNWKTGEKNRECLATLLKEFGEGKDTLETLSAERFEALLLAADASILERTFRTADRRQTAREIRLFVWIVDGKEAVFAIVPLASQQGPAHGFYTRDATLIGSFQELHAHYDSTAAPYAPPPRG